MDAGSYLYFRLGNIFFKVFELKTCYNEEYLNEEISAELEQAKL